MGGGRNKIQILTSISYLLLSSYKIWGQTLDDKVYLTMSRVCFSIVH